jgi:hypothetical protein
MSLVSTVTCRSVRHDGQETTRYGVTAAGSRVNTNMVPLLPRPIRTSLSTNVVSSQPLSGVRLMTASILNKKLTLSVGPLLKSKMAVSKEIIARFTTLGDGRNLPATCTRPQFRPTSLVIRDSCTLMICFTTRLDVSTLMPAAEIDPFALKGLVGMFKFSSATCGFQASGKASGSPTLEGDVYCRYQVPSRSSQATDVSVNRLVGDGKSLSSFPTMERTLACCSDDADLPLLVSETASRSDLF